MKKRIVSVLLSAALALPLAVSPALAEAADVPQREKAAVLKELEIMVGDETGALHLERGVTRSEFTKLLIAASPYKDAVGDSAGTTPILTCPTRAGTPPMSAARWTWAM